MDEITVIGTVLKTVGGYVIHTDDDHEYEISAIAPWESVPTDFDSTDFEAHLNSRMIVTGITDGQTIYRAKLSETNSD